MPHRPHEGIAPCSPSIRAGPENGIVIRPILAYMSGTKPVCGLVAEW